MGSISGLVATRYLCEPAPATLEARASMNNESSGYRASAAIWRMFIAAGAFVYRERHDRIPGPRISVTAVATTHATPRENSKHSAGST
ncbi:MULTISPECIES: hypothetical protein [Burkholderia]|uniref:hypothetical protein n=1 Tax=Burkholderia TaxID=32008 RepID=UPI000A7F89C4|nr:MULTISPECIES: hypothetical protein [Burkholderia]